jgi:two-component sensor histidine kinase
MNNNPMVAPILPFKGRLKHTLADTRLASMGSVSAHERSVMAQVPVMVQVLRAGQELVRQDSLPDSIYVLSEGWAYRSITMRGGARQIPTLVVPGGVCNLDNLLFERADFAVHSITKATVFALPRRQALTLVSEHPGIGRAFMSLALAENVILSQWAVGLGRRSAEERLAHFLCELAVRVGTSESGGISFPFPLTQELVADVLGLTAVHVSRVMRRLRDAGLMTSAERTVMIADIDRLRSFASFDPSYLVQIEKDAVTEQRATGHAGSQVTSHGNGSGELKLAPPVAEPEARLPNSPVPMRADDLLLRETHHRCNNDLQLVVGLLELQSRRATSEETRAALRDASERVAVLAGSRSALNSDRQPSLTAALRQVCEALNTHAEPREILLSTRVETEIHGLSQTQISTLALVVNELAINAIKHAFKGGAAGHIQITICRSAGRDLAVLITDDGVPFDDAKPATGPGLGMGLARRLMASIGGLFIPPAPGSKTFELRVPLGSA